MLSKSATLVTAQMSNNSSNVAYECQTTPSGNEKRTKRFPIVQNTLLRSKRGQKCNLREYMITYGIDNVSGKARTYSSKSGKSTPKNLP